MANIALIDGDALVYKAAFSIEKTLYDVYDEAKLVTTVKSIKEARSLGKFAVRQEAQSCLQGYRHIDNMLDYIQYRTGCEHLVVYLTDSDIRNNFRYVISNGTYKKQRKSINKPLHYANMREYLLVRYGAEIAPVGLEADDYLAMNQTEDTVIVSHDKDLLQVPGSHFSLTMSTLLEVEEPGTLELYADKAGTKRLRGTGFRFLCAQMLLGDEADNIQGVKGLGPVKIYNLFREIGKQEDYSIRKIVDTIRTLYRKHGLDFKLNCDLLFLKRKGADTLEHYLVTLEQYLETLEKEKEHGALAEETIAAFDMRNDEED